MSMLAFKFPTAASEYGYIHPTLRQVILAALDRWPDEYMEITRIYGEGGTGIHADGPPWRAADVRTLDLEKTEEKLIKLVEKKLVKPLNELFIYDPQRKKLGVALHHKVEGGALHLHLQVHSRTKRAGD